MKKTIILGSLLLATIAPSIQADFKLAAKVGPMLVSFDTEETSADPTNIGLSLAYNFALSSGIYGVEAEVTRSADAGEVNDMELDVESQGIYATYSTVGQIFFKVKLGLMDARLLAGDLSEDEGGETYGLGVGYRMRNFDLELEYTAVDDDVSFISVGLAYSYNL